MIKGIGNNTRVVDGFGESIVYLHGTPVVKIKRVNSRTAYQSDMWIIQLNSRGYRTATTKRRMNEVAGEYNLGFKVYQKNFDWYIDITQKLRGKWQSCTLDFIDGITFNVAVR